MSSLKHNEVAINRAISVKLDPDTIAIVAYVYHTRDKSDPTDKSFYRTEVRVAKIADLEAEAKTMLEPANRTSLWHWPNPTWPAEWYLGYDRANDQAKGAKWIRSKIRKAMPFNQYLDQVRDGVKLLRNGNQRLYAGAAYDHEDFEDVNGNTGLSILDKDTLLNHLNIPLWKKAVLKRDQQH